MRSRPCCRPGVHVSPSETLEQASGYPSRAYRVNLNVLAMVALFTGGFLVFSAQALEMARRRGEHALLRVLGLRRARPRAAGVSLEAAALGAVGGALGVVARLRPRAAALRAWGADLGAGAVPRPVPRSSHFSPPAALLFFLAGVGVALAGALLPALDAARAAPARALKAGDEQRMFQRAVSAWPGLAFLAAGAALAQLGPVNGLPLFGYAAIACLLIGAIASDAASLRLRVAQHRVSARRPPWSLAVAQLRGAPGQAAVSLAAIVASFSLMAAMAIMVASFRQSVDDGSTRCCRPSSTCAPRTPATPATSSPVRGARAGAAAGGARRVPAQRPRCSSTRRGRRLSLLARDRAATRLPRRRRALRAARRRPAAGLGERSGARPYGFAPGKRIELPLEREIHAVVVAGVFRDYARQHGAIADRPRRLRRAHRRPAVNDAALWLAPGRDAGAGDGGDPRAAGRRAARHRRSRARSARCRCASSIAASRSPTRWKRSRCWSGLFGLSSSLGAIVLARRREFGVLRHLGLTRAQIRAMLAAEGGLLALLGAAAGLAAGAAISLVLVYVVNRQSFNWSMELHPPYLLLALADRSCSSRSPIVTAVLSGREAMGMGPVRAVREDW